MDTLLGLAGVLVFIPSVIALAAGLTWAVVKLSPPKDRAAKAAGDDASAKPS